MDCGPGYGQNVLFWGPMPSLRSQEADYKRQPDGSWEMWPVHAVMTKAIFPIARHRVFLAGAFLE